MKFKRAELVPLLEELHELFEQFNRCTELMCQPGVEMSKAVDAGADREHIRARVVGCASRINRAAFGDYSS